MSNTFSVESILFKDINNNSINNTNIKVSKSIDDCVYDAYKSSEDLKFYETYTMINDYNTKQKLRMLNKLRNITKNIHNTNINNSCESYIRSIEENENNNGEKKKNIFIRIFEGIKKFISMILDKIKKLFDGIMFKLFGYKNEKDEQKNFSNGNTKDNQKSNSNTQKDNQKSNDKSKLSKLFLEWYQESNQDLIEKPLLNINNFKFSGTMPIDQRLDKIFGGLKTQIDEMEKKLNTPEKNYDEQKNIINQIQADSDKLVEDGSDFKSYFVKLLNVNEDAIISPDNLKNILNSNPTQIFDFTGLNNKNSGRQTSLFRQVLDRLQQTISNIKDKTTKLCDRAIELIKKTSEKEEALIESIKKILKNITDTSANTDKYLAIELQHISAIKTIYDRYSRIK